MVRQRSVEYAAVDVAAPSPTQLKVLVPGNHLMVDLLGQRDELLKIIESAFPVTIHVRGNEITVTGEPRRRRARRAALRGAGAAASSGATSWTATVSVARSRC